MTAEYGSQRLAGKRVLLVGGGAQAVPGVSDPPIGIGQAMAICFVREGASLLLVDIDPAASERTLALIEPLGGSAEAMQADVSSADGCSRIIGGAVETFGEIDGMVLNVGVNAKGTGFAGTTAEDWDRVFVTNVRAGFLLCRAAFAEGFADSASIVFTSSVVALRPVVALNQKSVDPAYAVSKSALVGLSGQVALEGAPRGIRSNIVVPGNIDSPARRVLMWRRNGGQGRDMPPSPMLSPVGRQGTGWDVAYATTYLLSDESAYVTSQILPIDGGLATLGPT